MKMILHLANAVENDNQSNTIYTFFSRFVFPTIFEPGTGLFRLERNLNVIWDKKTHNILPTYLFAKALMPSKSKFLLVFHALTVYGTTSFSAGHGIAKILKFFAFFVSLKGNIVIEIMK